MFKALFLTAFIVSICMLSGWTQDNALTPEEEALGWKLLFDGTEDSFDQWTRYGRNDLNNNRDILNAGWIAQGGFMSVGSDGSDIRTDKMYGDFVVKFDFTLDGNQGVIYRASLCGSTMWWSGVEYTMNSNPEADNKTMGSAYGLIAPVENNFISGDLNHTELVIVKDSVEHWQNGIKLLGYKYWSQEFFDVWYSWWRTRGGSQYTVCFCRPYPEEPDDDTPPTDASLDGYIESGYLAIQGDHSGSLRIKNFKVLENPVIGCMDSTRAGYVPRANYDRSTAGGDECGDPVPGVCKDPTMANYNESGQWHDPDACIPIEVHIQMVKGENITLESFMGRLKINTENISASVSLGVFDISGSLIRKKDNLSPADHVFKGLQNGIYVIEIAGEGFRKLRRVMLF